MDTRRLQLLLALSRLGSMRAVAEAHHLTTSTVSQQIAALAKETGAQLIEPRGDGCGSRPPANALRTMRSPSWPPSTAHGSTSIPMRSRPARYGSAASPPASGSRCCRSSPNSPRRYPKVEFLISEYEPIEAFALLTNDDLDLALTYDYNLAPASPGPVLETVALWSIAWGLGVPDEYPDGPADIAAYAEQTWIVNSRNTADETRCARWPRSPDSSHGSPTRSTAWSWWRISSSPATAWACCRSGGPRAAVSKSFRCPNPRPC